MADALTRVRVFHNNHRRDAQVVGYSPDHSVTEVLAYDLRDGEPAGHAEHVVFAHHMLNDGDGPQRDDRAELYRLRGNRPLGTGDVVAIVDGSATSFYALGDAITPIAPPRIDLMRGGGTTPVDDEGRRGCS